MTIADQGTSGICPKSTDNLEQDQRAEWAALDRDGLKRACALGDDSDFEAACDELAKPYEHLLLHTPPKKKAGALSQIRFCINEVEHGMALNDEHVAALMMAVEFLAAPSS